jgi:hypothetical protein
MAWDMSGIYELEDDTWFTTPRPDYAKSAMAADPGLLVILPGSGTIYLQK